MSSSSLGSVVAMTVVALITWLTAPPPSLPGLISLVLVSEEEEEDEEDWGGILEMKGWIDQAPVFASPQLPLFIVSGRLGLLI